MTGWPDWKELTAEQQAQRIKEAEDRGERTREDEHGSSLWQPCPECGNTQGPVIGVCGCSHYL